MIKKNISFYFPLFRTKKITYTDIVAVANGIITDGKLLILEVKKDTYVGI